MLKKHWYKILAVLLLIYVFIAGMLAPLKPGITLVTPSSVRTGDTVTLEIQGYNSNFEKAAGSIRAWLKLDDERALGAESVAVRDDRRLSVVFQIPEYLPAASRVQDFTMVLDNAWDGPSVLPSAVFVTQDSIDPEMGLKMWSNDPVADLNDSGKMTFPFRNILSETIRNTYFHVPLWFGMIFLFLASVAYSWRYLRHFHPDDDNRARSYTSIGILYGILGLVTGAIWAKNTWGAYWSWDVKQNMTAIALLIYMAYFILRASFDDSERKGRISAVYNLFAFATLIPLIYVIPRMTDSLHPGAGGNIAFGSQDLDNTMRMVFYPAVIGWTLLGFWCADLLLRANRIQEKLYEL
jgi:heme exporter protein C